MLACAGCDKHHQHQARGGLGLSEEEDALVRFMQALTDGFMQRDQQP
jgi:hypothetical protein